MTVTLEQRHLRSQDLISQETLNQYGVTILGVGAIGSQLAEQLVKMGVNRLTLMDFDAVTPVNLGSQGFCEGDVGFAKVSVVADRLKAIDSNVSVVAEPVRWDPSVPLPSGPVFLLVDSIEVRKAFFNHVFTTEHCRHPVMLDGRMTAEGMQLCCIDRKQVAHRKAYRETLFPASEAFREGCTAKATIYCASIAAGLICLLYKQWIMRTEHGYYHWRAKLNLRAFDLFDAEIVLL